MHQIAISEDLFHGAVSLQPSDSGLRPWRLPWTHLDLFHEALVARGGTCAGVRIAITTDSSRVDLQVDPYEGDRRFDLTVDNDLVATLDLPAEATQLSFSELPPGEKTVSIWFPQGGPVIVQGLAVEDGASAAPYQDPRKKWVTYGSSITHCGAAHSPSRTWPATAARLRDVNLTCLGYGGNCHMEPRVAMMIRDLPADAISLKLGINVQGACSLGPRTFQSAVIGLVSIIREGHPTTPITCISSIVSPPRESNPNTVGITLPMMREWIADAVEKLRGHGDQHLHYFDGLGLFPSSLIETNLPDQLHPDGDGYEAMGHQAAQHILPAMGL